MLIREAVRKRSGGFESSFCMSALEQVTGPPEDPNFSPVMIVSFNT